MIGIVIVTWNSEDVIGPCLESCFANPGVRVVVVDNASSDGTRREILKFPSVHAIFSDTNLGFAGGVNRGIAALDTELVLLLNPDAALSGGLTALAACFDDPSVGAATGDLIGTGGEDQSGFHLRSLPTPATLACEALGVNRVWRSNPVNRRYRGVSTTGEVEQPAAAFLMIRRSAWETVRGFDERFHPVWFEDVDFCKRLRDDGWKIRYVPDARARHCGGHSAARISWSDKQLYWYASLLKYADTHYPAASRALVSAAVMAACGPRMVWSMFSRRNLQAVPVYSKVFSLAARTFAGSEGGARSEAAGAVKAAGG